MEKYIKLVPAEYWYAKMEFLAKELEKVPVVRAGYRGSSKVYRVYDEGRHRYREFGSRSKHWNRLSDICCTREKLEAEINTVKEIIKANYRKAASRYKVVNTGNHYGNEFFDSLVDSSCPNNNSNEYFYNGRNYRSRAEMMFAVLLDDLGLEFKYDVLVTFGKKSVTYDFVIVFREFNRCIFIEYYGKCEDPGYISKNCSKIEIGYESDIYIGRDLFIFSGKDNYMPGKTVALIQLISIIAQIAEYHLKLQADV